MNGNEEMKMDEDRGGVGEKIVFLRAENLKILRRKI